MSTFLAICMIGAMAAVLAVLLIGILALAKGGEFNRKWGNKLMRARVILQFLALALFALAAINWKK
ncbi:MAG: twin transmembrane helix small protein [Alphaproteobacteria bacterium]